MDIGRIAKLIIEGNEAQSLSVANLIDAADDAYGDGLIRSYFDEPEGQHGDTLAKFITSELQDTYEEGQGSQVIIDEAVRAMDTAIRDVSSVRDALSNIGRPGGVVRPGEWDAAARDDAGSPQASKKAQIDPEQHGGIWGEHPNHPVSDWQYEVANGDTRLGYWGWAEHQAEMGA